MGKKTTHLDQKLEVVGDGVAGVGVAGAVGLVRDLELRVDGRLVETRAGGDLGQALVDAVARLVDHGRVPELGLLLKEGFGEGLGKKHIQVRTD